MSQEQVPLRTILEEIDQILGSPGTVDQNNKQLSDLAADIRKKLVYLKSDNVQKSDREKLQAAVKNLKDPSPTQKIAGALTRAQEGWEQLRGKSQSDGAGDKILSEYLTIRQVLQVYYAPRRIEDVLKQVEVEEGKVSFEKPLTEEESLSVFIEQTLQGSDSSKQEPSTEINPKLEEIGKEIVKKCEGVRLVLEKVAEGLSRNRDQISDWELVRDNFSECLRVLFYDKYLPEHLKPCFFSCCLFPEDYEIDVQTLISLWMALDLIKATEASSSAGREDTSDPHHHTLKYFLKGDGDIKKKQPGDGDIKKKQPGDDDGDKELEETGREYFEKLLDKGLLVSESTDVTGSVTICKMPSLSRQLAIHVARKCIIPFSEKVSNIPEEVRHVSFTFGPDARSDPSFSSSQIPKELSTLLLFSKADTSTSASADNQDHKKRSSGNREDIISGSCSSKLHVLGLNNMGIKTLPNSIFKCTELVYLDLSQNNMDKLPDAITKLNKLQTLKLSHCHLLQELPKDMSRLSGNLRHLIIDGCDALIGMPQGLGALTSLRTLSRFLVGDMTSTYPENKKKEGGFTSLLKRNDSTRRIRGASDAGPSARLEELRALTKLSGNLEIFHLDRLKDKDTARIEAEKVELHWKKYLGGLTLKWHGPSGEGVDEEQQDLHKATLDGLQPHSNLKRLFLSGYKDEQFPDWISSLPTLKNLVKFTLFNCPNCKYLSQLDGLPVLKVLEVLRMQSLEHINLAKEPSPSPSPSGVSKIFGSLNELNLSSCPKLKGWVITKSSKTTLSFSCLSKLQIRNCPLLTSMPLYPELDDQLILVSASLEPLKQTIEMTKQDPLSKLKHLYIEKASKHDQPQINFSLDGRLFSFSSLENLKIKDSQLFDLFKKDGNMSIWNGLKKLRSLTLWGISDLESLPKGLLQVKTLEYLRVFNCPSLVKLPEPINELNSLKRLVISKCQRMSSLPNGLQDLKLNSLVIEDSPNLLARCQKDTGEDWPKIKNIPNFSLKSTTQDLD